VSSDGSLMYSVNRHVIAFRHGYHRFQGFSGLAARHVQYIVNVCKQELVPRVVHKTTMSKQTLKQELHGGCGRELCCLELTTQKERLWATPALVDYEPSNHGTASRAESSLMTTTTYEGLHNLESPTLAFSMS
jgi:hypothetical protein